MAPSTLPLRIGVIGAGDGGDFDRDAAEAVGREIAARGAILYCGGLGGAMAAAARGASEAGGVTVGILPGEDAAAANPWITHPVLTGMGEARNVVLVRSVEGVIAIGGSWGTLSEIALARKLGKVLVGIGTWRLDDEPGEPVPQVGSAAEAVEYVVSRIRDGEERRRG